MAEKTRKEFKLQLLSAENIILAKCDGFENEIFIPRIRNGRIVLDNLVPDKRCCANYQKISKENSMELGEKALASSKVLQRQALALDLRRIQTKPNNKKSISPTHYNSSGEKINQVFMKKTKPIAKSTPVAQDSNKTEIRRNSIASPKISKVKRQEKPQIIKMTILPNFKTLNAANNSPKANQASIKEKNKLKNSFLCRDKENIPPGCATFLEELSIEQQEQELHTSPIFNNRDSINNSYNNTQNSSSSNWATPEIVRRAPVQINSFHVSSSPKFNFINQINISKENISNSVNISQEISSSSNSSLSQSRDSSICQNKTDSIADESCLSFINQATPTISRTKTTLTNESLQKHEKSVVDQPNVQPYKHRKLLRDQAANIVQHCSPKMKNKLKTTYTNLNLSTDSTLILPSTPQMCARKLLRRSVLQSNSMHSPKWRKVLTPKRTYSKQFPIYGSSAQKSEGIHKALLRIKKPVPTYLNNLTQGLPPEYTLQIRKRRKLLFDKETMITPKTFKTQLLKAKSNKQMYHQVALRKKKLFNAMKFTAFDLLSNSNRVRHMSTKLNELFRNGCLNRESPILPSFEMIAKTNNIQ